MSPEWTEDNMNDKYVIIIDTKGCWDIPGLAAIDNIYLKDKEALDDLLIGAAPGIYEMRILATESYKGQRGEYGSWECAPYDVVSKIALTQIGEVREEWKTNSQRYRQHLDMLKRGLDDFARSLPQNYVLRPSWCNTIGFGEKSTPDSWLVKPLKSYPNKLTEDNVEHIIRDVTFYLENEYFEHDAPVREEE
jgi:hypothetical protein